jgi:hypothetical protein
MQRGDDDGDGGDGDALPQKRRVRQRPSGAEQQRKSFSWLAS